MDHGYPGNIRPYQGGRQHPEEKSPQSAIDSLFSLHVFPTSPQFDSIIVRETVWRNGEMGPEVWNMPWQTFSASRLARPDCRRLSIPLSYWRACCQNLRRYRYWEKYVLLLNETLLSKHNKFRTHGEPAGAPQEENDSEAGVNGRNFAEGKLYRSCTTAREVTEAC